MMTPEQLKEKLRWTIENIWNQNNFDLAPQTYADDIVVHSPSHPQPLRGREDGLRELHTLLHTAYPDFHVEIVEMVAQGTAIALRWIVSGTNLGPNFGAAATMKPNGKSFSSEEMALAHFNEEGRVQELWFNMNVLDVMVQLELMPPGPPPKAMVALIGLTQKVRHPLGGPRRPEDAGAEVPATGDTVVSEALPVLVVTEGARAGERYAVENELSLGRDDADVSLDDPMVSRWHAILRYANGGLEIADANSSNGTFVNDARIDSVVRLVDGDSIRVGGTTLTVELPVVELEPESPPALVVMSGANAGERFEIERDLTLGRWDADVLLNDMEISRRHAVINIAGGAVEIADAGSANGTFVNHARIDGSQPLV